MTQQTEEKNKLDGLVTVITGASSGIGAAIARKFTAHGSRVVLSARREDRLNELAEELRDSGSEAEVVPGDVTDYAQVKRLADKTIKRFGQIDILINNAGYAIARPLLETSVEHIDGQIDANLKGVAYGCHAMLPHMVERKTGHVINIGSVCSFNHYPNYAAYVGAKYGVLGFSKSVYEEVRPHGIRVNAICPAAVNTAWSGIAGADLPWPKEERLQPEDIAEIAYFCVSMPARVVVENLVVWPLCEPTV